MAPECYSYALKSRSQNCDLDYARHSLDTLLDASWTRGKTATLLKQIKGVGTLIALTFLLTLEDPHRFRKSRDVGFYVGF